MNHTKKIIMVTVFALWASQAHAWSWGGAAETVWNWARTHKRATVVVLGVFGVTVIGSVLAYFVKPRGGAMVAPVPAPVVQPVVVVQQPEIQPGGGQGGVVVAPVPVQVMQPEVPVRQPVLVAPVVHQVVARPVEQPVGDPNGTYILEADDQGISIPYDGIQFFSILKNKLKHMQNVRVENGKDYYVSLNDEVGTIKVLYDQGFVPEYHAELNPEQRDISRETLISAIRHLVDRINDRQWDPSYGGGEPGKFSYLLLFEVMMFVAIQMGAEQWGGRNLVQEIRDDLVRVYRQPAQ